MLLALELLGSSHHRLLSSLVLCSQELRLVLDVAWLCLCPQSVCSPFFLPSLMAVCRSGMKDPREVDLFRY